ncbi:uncharacterized protein METZ01_LOCUS361020, partial [marine metagenome]
MIGPVECVASAFPGGNTNYVLRLALISIGAGFLHRPDTGFLFTVVVGKVFVQYESGAVPCA